MKHTSSLDSSLSTVRTEGGLLPADILAKILAGDGRIPGTTPEDYHLPKGEKLNESINRAWSRVRALWEKFRLQREALTDTDTGTSQTRETLLLPLFAELGYGRLFSSKAEDRTVGDKVFSISHFWHHSPIHLVGCQVELDRKAKGVRGAAQSSPHSMVQDFLNRSEGHLWGFCSNGLRLRILRDNQSLSRQAFIEFDLESMFEGEVFSDFALLWLLCHQSRVESDDTATCWLEIWARSAQEQGVRALDTLRDSVRKTIEILGQGFLEHHNPDLKDRLRSGALSRQDYFRQLLRLVYRLLFLFAAEDRALLHATGTPEDARQRYAVWHSTARLRRLATKLAGTKHHDLYECLKLIMRQLGSEDGCPELGLSPLGSFLWSDEALPDLAPARLSNEHLLRAVRALSFMEAEGLRRPVDFKNVGARELGSIYESLLELHPDLDTVSGAFILQTASGNERKTTGSYYTPTALINCLLDSALEPVIQQAMAQGDPEQSILDLKICDPASGSGHFLIAAAHRLAKRLAGVRTGDEEPGPDAMRTALRDVIGRCIYGVDLNPMAVELCKVSLWLEALEPGKPLSFLDHHIRCGNSLIGTTPELIAAGLPDEAFKAIEGDEKTACAALKKRNKASQKKSTLPFLVKQEAEIQAKLRQTAAALESIPSNSLRDIHAKEHAFRQHEGTPEFLRKKNLADAWCAAFVMRKYFPPKPGHPALKADEPVGITQRELNDYAMGQPLDSGMALEVEKLTGQYKFFHWHLAFPEVFGRDGFDVMLGNPPWERVKLQEKEWFAERSPEIANAPNAAARKKLIAQLQTNDPEFYQAFLDDSRKAEGESHLMRSSGRYPLCGRGDINVYTIFAEAARTLINESGRMGCVLPSGIATDDTTKFFFQDLVDRKSLVSLFDFENKGIFPGVHSSYKFCLLTVGRGLKPTADRAEFVFFAHSVDELREPERRFTLSAEDIARLNPNTRTCPIFRTRHDAELTKAIYRRVPVLIREARDGQPEENPWGIKFGTMFHMSNDSHLFRTREQLEAEDWELDGNVFRKGDGEYLPLYEAKMATLLDHRSSRVIRSTTATIRQAQPEYLSEKEHEDATTFATPLYWVPSNSVTESTPNFWRYNWVSGWRRVSAVTNERTFLQTIFPFSGFGDSVFLMYFDSSKHEFSSMLGSLSSFAFDFVVRQKMGGVNLSFYLVAQFPVLQAEQLSIFHLHILPRILELTYTAWDLKPFAQDCGFDGPPFRWDEDRRFLLRCELDAAFFHLYLPANADGTWKKDENETAAEFAALCATFTTPREAVDYIMDTFSIVKRKDGAKYGEYRTKRTILEIYDAIQHASVTGQPYQTRLDPPPANPRCCHLEKTAD
jgi:methylase of polypeptide subunit release factors